MVAVHATVGSLVVISFAVLAVLYAVAASGRPLPWLRYVSYLASGILLVQLFLGISLLMEGHVNVGTHYLLALLTIIPVGFEHGYAQRQATPRRRATFGAVAALAAAVVATLAYLIGDRVIG